MQAEPRHQSPGATCTLDHRCLADSLGLQTRHAAAGVKQCAAFQRTVDHQPNPLNGQAGFGDIGGKHHFAAAGGGRQNCPALRRQRQCAIERRQINVVTDA